ncbi:MAG: pseudouridine synthase [Candidatus Woesearchaeota archaeon]
MERIQKIIAANGFCSRRKAEELIIKGIVKVNGKIAKIGDTANNEDKITVDNYLIKPKEKKYYILNKPKGLIVTTNDPQERNTIYSLPSLSKLKERIYPVGRLDAMSEGLLILTNDGDLANKLMHPRYEVKKTYQVRCQPTIKDEDIEKLEKGIIIDGKKTSSAIIKKIKKDEFLITIHEGRNRIIRKMMTKLRYKIYNLKRIGIDDLKLGNLLPGDLKQINKKELINKIKIIS